VLQTKFILWLQKVKDINMLAMLDHPFVSGTFPVCDYLEDLKNHNTGLTFTLSQVIYPLLDKVIEEAKKPVPEEEKSFEAHALDVIKNVMELVELIKEGNTEVCAFL